tara:strand:- start:27 stop:821 length:795 start_codon:yes stop_codon:yes gene_type:complete
MERAEISQYVENEKAVCNNTIKQLKEELLNHIFKDAFKNVVKSAPSLPLFSTILVENIEQGTFAVVEDNSQKRVIKIKDNVIYDVDELEDCLKKMRKKLNIKVDQRSIFFIERSDEIDFSLRALEGIYKNNHLLYEVYAKKEYIIYVSYFIPTGDIVKEIFTIPKVTGEKIGQETFSINNHFIHFLQNPKNGSIFGMIDVELLGLSYTLPNDTLNFLGLSKNPLDKYQQYEDTKNEFNEIANTFNTFMAYKDKRKIKNMTVILH